MAYHGIDLHLDSLLDAKMELEGGLINNEPQIKMIKYYLTGESFEKFKNSLSKDDYIIIEACTNAFWLYDQIKDQVKGCYILNTNKYKANQNKTDKIDSKKLVKKLAYYVLTNGDKDDLPTVYVPEKEVRNLRALFTTYTLIKKMTTQLKNRIHSILKENGNNIAKNKLFTKNFKGTIEKIDLDNISKYQVLFLFNELTDMENKVEQHKNLIYKVGYDLFKEEIKILLTIKGFSPLTAIALMSDIADINRFESVKKYCAYLRTAPKIKSSNEKKVIGQVNKAARTLTCRLLSQSVNHFAIAGEPLTKFYDRVKIGKKAGVYRMALIRKILVSSYYMLKREKNFYWIDESLYNKKLCELNKILENYTNDNWLENILEGLAA